MKSSKKKLVSFNGCKRSKLATGMHKKFMKNSMYGNLNQKRYDCITAKFLKINRKNLP